MPRPRFIHGTYREIAASLAAEIRSRRAATPPDHWIASPIEVLVPSRSAAAELARAVIADGVATAGLALHSLETLATRIVHAGGGYPRIPAAQEQELAMGVACESSSDPLARTAGIEAMLLRSYRDVRDAGITVGEFSRRAAASPNLRDRGRTMKIASIWSEYERVTTRNLATDESEVFARAIEALRAGASLQPQFIFGFYDTTGVQLGLLEALIERGLVPSIYLPAVLDTTPLAPDTAYAFASEFARRALEWSGGTAQRSTPRSACESWTVSMHATPADERREACRAIRSLLDAGVCPADIAIVTRSVDPAYATLLQSAARQFGFDVSGIPGRPLHSNRVVRGVLGLLHLRERHFLRRDVMEIIRCGVGASTVGPRPDASALELATRRARVSHGEEARIRRIAETRTRLPEPDPRLIRYAEIVGSLDRLTKPFATAVSGNHWRTTLETLPGHFDIRTTEDVAAVGTIREIAALLARPSFEGRRFAARDIVSLIESAGDLGNQPSDGPAVLFTDVMKMRGRAFRHVIAVRMQYDVLPQRRVEDPLIPDRDRELLGLRKIGDGRDEERMLFEILCTAATESLQFHFATSDGIGGSLRPSPFLEDFAVARLPDRAAAITGEFAKFVASLAAPPKTAVSVPEARRAELLANPDAPFIRKVQLQTLRDTDGPFDGFTGELPGLRQLLESVLRGISPSKLEQIGQCPQRFLISTVLGAEDIEEAEPELRLAARQRGTVAHAILKAFYEGLDDDAWGKMREWESPGLPPDLDRRLADAVESAFAQHALREPAINDTLRAIERDEAVEDLRDFLRDDMRQLIAEGFRPERFELGFDPSDERAILSSGGIAIGLRGSIDRLDRGSGTWRIVDYKSGGASRLKDIGGLVDDAVHLQLPLYLLVIENILGAGPASLSAAIRPLGSSDVKDADFRFELDAKRRTILDNLETLIGAAVNGRFPAVPYEPNKMPVCDYCQVSEWCRTRIDPREHDAWRETPAIDRLGGSRS